MNPQLQAILYALSRGSAPMGNQAPLMPTLRGLGAQQDWLKQATPAQSLNASNVGILTSRS